MFLPLGPRGLIEYNSSYKTDIPSDAEKIYCFHGT
jgi:hypothetical protein